MATKKKEKKKSAKSERIVGENVNRPGRKRNVAAAAYDAAKATFLKVLPKSEPGLTQSEMMSAVHKARPPGELRDKSGQLDLEARGCRRTRRKVAVALASRMSTHACAATVACLLSLLTVSPLAGCASGDGTCESPAVLPPNGEVAITQNVDLRACTTSDDAGGDPCTVELVCSLELPERSEVSLRGSASSGGAAIVQGGDFRIFRGGNCASSLEVQQGDDERIVLAAGPYDVRVNFIVFRGSDERVAAEVRAVVEADVGPAP